VVQYKKHQGLILSQYGPEQAYFYNKRFIARLKMSKREEGRESWEKKKTHIFKYVEVNSFRIVSRETTRNL